MEDKRSLEELIRDCEVLNQELKEYVKKFLDEMKGEIRNGK